MYAYIISIVAIYFAYLAFQKKTNEVCAQTIFVRDGVVEFVNCDVFSNKQVPVLKELAKQVTSSVWEYKKSDHVGYAITYQNILRYIKPYSDAAKWINNEYTRTNGADGKGPISKEEATITIDMSNQNFKTKAKDDNRWLLTFLATRKLSQVQGSITETYNFRMLIEKGDHDAIYKVASIAAHRVDE
jgi:hypothetical protein